MDTSVRAGRPLYPRGPRSGPGYSVPVHPHLIDPIRPTRRHNSTSPLSGLYEMSSLCISGFQCLGNPRVVPCFRWPSVSTCCPLGSREAHRLLAPSSFTNDAGLRPKRKVSALPISHTPILVRGFISGLTYGSLSLRPVDLLAPPCRSRPGLHPADRGFYVRAFDGLVTRTVAGYNYRGNWASSPDGTFTR